METLVSLHKSWGQYMTGQPCDMERIQELNAIYGFHIIYDASRAVGGYFNKSPVDSCRYRDVTVFSFHPVKIINTAARLYLCFKKSGRL